MGAPAQFLSRSGMVPTLVQTVTASCRIQNLIFSYRPVTCSKIDAIHTLKSQGTALRCATIEASDGRCSRRKPQVPVGGGHLGSVLNTRRSWRGRCWAPGAVPNWGGRLL